MYSCKSFALPLISISALLSFAGCNQPSDGQSEVSVYNGREARSGYPEKDSTVSLVYGSSGNFEQYCSGTLIAPRVMTTAAHCAQDAPSGLRAFFGTNISHGNNENTIKIVRKLSSPDTDLALFFLASDAPASHKPVQILPESLSINRGDAIVAAGFGETQASSYGRLWAVDAKVSKVDSNMIQVDHRNGSGVCNGDSGGPLYISKNGKWYLIGAVSGGEGNCGREYVDFANIHANQSWVRKNANLGNPTTQPDPTTGAGDNISFKATPVGNGKMEFEATVPTADQIEVWVDRLNVPLYPSRLKGPTSHFVYTFSTKGVRIMTIKGFRNDELIAEKAFDFEIE